MSLWTCPDCGRGFANRNQVHTCAGLHDLDHHFARRPTAVRALFDALTEAARACGPVIVLPEKTRIAFQVRMSFMAVMPRNHGLRGHLVLAERVEDPRWTRIETFSPRNHLHAFSLTDQGQIDDWFRGRLAEAYAVGAQRHLASPAP
ncbi:hypothetical protein QO010_002444 [Caulobacter ginsengisoli]|uniref:DUF5655 domain-containing protein n=1 Tax=Caulobacter ginsengisoli TaxID=400775 RepID=A0ABU0IRL7_9CAUL|nr:DUF5655 domain-containing protein [Caulobacter ginsengisoli]MDQ0464660.1 hypothetical protein [Caulobacter ginsengisoli]